MATVFEMIINGEIPSVKLYEDDKCIVILDINPVAKGHSLVISKEVYPTIEDCPAELLSHLILVAKRISAEQKSKLGADATNILINNGPAAGQEVPHLHIHVIPRYNADGQKFGFSHESYLEGEIARYGAMLALDKE